MNWTLSSAALALALHASVALANPTTAVRDEHSYANTAQFRATHASLDLTAQFDRQILVGSVTLSLDRIDPKSTQIVLDTRDLDIGSVTHSTAAAASAASAAFPPRSSARRPARVASGWLAATIASAATAGGRPNAKR